MTAKILLCLALISASDAAEIPDSSYYYANSLYEQEEKEQRALALDEYRAYLRVWPHGRFSDDARYRVGKLYQQSGDERRAMLWYLKVPYLNPDSLRLATALEDARLMLDVEKDLHARGALYKQALGYRAGEEPLEARHRAYLEAVLAIDEAEIRLDVADEVRGFLERYPERHGNDTLQLELGNLLLKADARHRAVAAYRKVEFLYGTSPLVPNAMLRGGDVTWKKLGEPYDALRIYEKLAREYPGISEAATALFHMGEIEQKELKYEIAIRDFDEVADKYPWHVHAVDSLLAKAEVYAKNLDNPKQAIAVYDDLVARFGKDSRAARAFERAAELCDKKLRDARCAIDYYTRLARVYETDREAPESLYRAGELSEKKVGDSAHALELYREVVDRFAGSKWAKKARKKVVKLTP